MHLCSFSRRALANACVRCTPSRRFWQGFYYKKGSFSWAARNRGPTPPVKRRVRLHVGLFNNTLGPFLTSGMRGAVSWASCGGCARVCARARFYSVRVFYSRVCLMFACTHACAVLAADGAQRPLAYVNIDCDLYAGTRDALKELGPRMCPGTVIHFHELLKDRYWKARHYERARTSMPWPPLIHVPTTHVIYNIRTCTHTHCMHTHATTHAVVSAP